MAGVLERADLAIGQNRAVADVALLVGARDRAERGDGGELRRIPPPPRSLASEEARRDIRYDRIRGQHSTVPGN